MIDKWIFITGNQWGGKDLIRIIINHHLDAQIFSDTNFPVNFYDICIPPMVDHRMDRKHSYNFHLTTVDGRSTYELPFTEWSASLHVPYLANTIVGDGVEFVRNLCHSVGNFFPDKTILGDCSVLYAFRWKVLYELFPDMKFVVVNRDVNKCLETIEDTAPEHVRLCQEGKQGLEKYLIVIDSHLRQIPSDLSYHIDLREFKSSDPVKTMKELWDYLEVDSDIDLDFVNSEINRFPEE